MAEDKSRSELLKRKFEPVSDWRPAKAMTLTDRIKSSVSEAIEDAQELTEDAKVKIGKAASLVEEVAGKSSKEARSFLSKALATLADKIKPD